MICKRGQNPGARARGHRRNTIWASACVLDCEGGIAKPWPGCAAALRARAAPLLCDFATTQHAALATCSWTRLGPGGCSPAHHAGCYASAAATHEMDALQHLQQQGSRGHGEWGLSSLCMISKVHHPYFFNLPVCSGAARRARRTQPCLHRGGASALPPGSARLGGRAVGGRPKSASPRAL